MIDTCYLSKDEKSFFVSTVEGKVIVYNLPSFQQTTTLDYKNVNYQRFSIDRDEHFVLVSNSQGVFRTACPISTKNPVIISNNINIPEIKKFLNDQREGDQAINNNWIIAPFMVNSLHNYSFKNEKIYELPIVTYALTFQVNPEVFLGKNIEEGGKRISFLISTIRMNLEIGSSESIAFLESLLKCSNTEIFKTKFIQAILNDKWTRIR